MSVLHVCLYFNIFIESYEAAVVNNVGGLTLNIRIMTSFAHLPHSAHTHGTVTRQPALEHL